MKLRSRIFVIFVCVLLCLCNDQKVYAVSNPIENSNASGPIVIVKDQFVVTINYGFSQEARYSRYVNFGVDIYNKGETLEGDVKATLLNSEQENVTYAKKVKLTGGEKSQVTINLPMNYNTQEVNFSIEDSNGKTIVEETIPFNIKNYCDSCLIGVLCDNPVSLSYLQYFGNNIVILTKDNLSNDYLTYDMLDTIVVDDFDLDSLEAGQIEGLLDFVAVGGNLVLGIDEDSQSNIELLEQYNAIKIDRKISYDQKDNPKLQFSLFLDTDFTRMLTGIRDYESSRNSWLQQIEEAKATTPDSGEGMFIGKSMLGSCSITDIKQQELSKQVAGFTLCNAENVIEKDDVRLYEQITYGNGNILVFHFCLQNNEITEDKLTLYEGCGDELFSSFYAEVAYLIKQNLSSVSKNRIEREANSEPIDYRIQEIKNYSEITNVPRVGWYIAILLIYIIIVGPVIFFILWKIKKQSKLWVIILSVSIVFFAIVYLAGTNTRINEPYAGYLNIEYYDNELSKVQGSVYAYVGLSKNHSDTVNFDNADAVTVGDNDYMSYYDLVYTSKPEERRFYDYTDDSISVTYNSDRVHAQFHDRAPFNLELFRGVYQKRQESLLDTDLTLTKESFDGTVTNRSNETLYNTLLYLCGHYVDLGTLKPGDSIQLSDCASAYMDDIEEILFSDNDIKKAWKIDEKNLSTAQTRRIDAYSYTFDQYMFHTQQPCIIASLDHIPDESPLQEIAKGEASYGESVIVEKVNLRENSKKESIVLNIDKYLSDSSLYTWYENTRYCYTNSIDFTYNIPKSDHVTELYLSNLFNRIDTKEFNQNNCGRIYLFNYSANKYDLVFDLYSKYGTRSISGSDLTKYFNSENQIMIRYESNNAGNDGFNVPIVSCRKETANAEN